MENITPAVQLTDEKELSPQEFQQLLSSWFQEKGIVQDMKSYLKFQMISSLKNTVIGKNIRKCVPQKYSLAQQAIHLIVAEYLLQNQCHFTLSLFSNEVNLTNTLTPDKLFFCNDNISKEAANKFDKENLINILELIGIPKDNEHFAKIINQYFDERVSSLLNCLIDLIGKNIPEQNNNFQECKTDIEFEDDFMGNICHVLQSLNLSEKMQNKLLHNIKLCYDLKTKSFENQCIKLISKFKKELNVRDKTFHEGEKQKRSLEKRLLKTQEENESLKEKINSLLKEHEVVETEKILPLCSLNHCNEKCNSSSRLYETYKKEIEILRIENKDQREEIQRLNFKFNELLKEFNCCQSKINLVSTRIQEDTFEEANLLATGYVDKNIDNKSLDSDTTITEEILQQAREKLKLLEEESKQLDIRFSNFVIK